MTPLAKWVAEATPLSFGHPKTRLKCDCDLAPEGLGRQTYRDHRPHGEADLGAWAWKPWLPGQATGNSREIQGPSRSAQHKGTWPGGAGADVRPTASAALVGCEPLSQED